MTITHLLIANRGEIAIRIARAAAELGLRTTAVHSADDALSLHVKAADEAVALKGEGAAAYLDIAGIVAAAKAAKCDAIHPGYGFLSENADFARACAEAGIIFVGPNPEALELFGDKIKAKALALASGVPLLAGTQGATSLDDARAFFKAHGPMMIKAIAGGGGRGMRPVRGEAEIDEAYKRCQSEAKAAFGNGDVYVEKLIEKARHVEVQIVADSAGGVAHLFERECSIQRRNQKIVEIAPSPSLSEELRDELCAAAVMLARAAAYDNLGTFEFLVDAADMKTFAFIEANPRLQVEHTVTEEVTGVDLVQTQLKIASGKTLRELGLTQGEVPYPRGHAIQLRINMETMDESGNAKPAGGIISVFEPPSGPGIRVDTFGYAGYRTSPNFDSLLAKLIVHVPSVDYRDAVRRAARALSEFRLEGVSTNISFLRALVAHPAFATNDVTTRFVEEHVAELVKSVVARERYFAGGATQGVAAATAIKGPEGSEPVGAPMQGKVVSIDVKEGDKVHAGQQIAVLEAMKMEHLVHAAGSGIVRLVAAAAGEVLFDGQPIVFIEPGDVGAATVSEEKEVDLDYIRPDLTSVRERHFIGLDEGRPDAVARRRKTNQRTARENIADLCDEGSFIEYGSLALAAQRRRRPMDELIKMSPADGMIAGIGAVNGAMFDEDKARTMVLSYDYTVFAGTQGAMNHKKKDRMFKIAEQWRLPIVFFTEGGGGRPGDTDSMGVAGLDTPSFLAYAQLSGLVPRVGINSGRCFAGNAAILGTSDVIIATKNSAIGMGGPAMIEGGGLGVFLPDEVGPVEVQAPNGVIDVLVEDEAEAVAAAKKYLSYFQGPVAQWDCADQRKLRHLIPENRLRIYDIRAVIDALCDTGSVLELRRDFAHGMVTALVRIEGRPMGLIANNPTHLAGAIDADGADKAARFMQLCDAFGLPILSLCDTPGFMVGPEAEKTALVRRVSRMFVTAGSLNVPIFTIVLRKGYGLGAQAMAGGSFHAPFFIVSWPTGEFGGMGLEGAVRLGYRKEMEAIKDPVEQKEFFDKMVARSYEHGKAVNMASFLEIDEVIDPFETRRWIARGLASLPKLAPTEGKRRSFIDTW
ncbi:biotin/lipoyl-binding protein [Parvibaculum sedimenti]|uniref:Biotin/lipoyl-binding protein n=1 Tax=Parvibaculum sedimenti TaxID=2608632 RepID=A0A6N6VK75_9HYPH|nr:carboxyl transferase domain-containing protein [Parvibaculum sedimenti]KAB7742095.1 biotin/lipoyl-binding protein [Parvibaculum sedimenti]